MISVISGNAWATGTFAQTNAAVTKLARRRRRLTSAEKL
ncbi:hypothetical protein LAUMK13_02537 [Mycobacterium innocens]|uniref:Uncharacterized protein n=1 Tax=Mycobacterium innocens TaxID=2341083 RepID=A0A498Q1Y0_9MYCO|nr:hypothetical protein LAUMK13_02537 [Mycobacterium innocens]